MQCNIMQKNIVHVHFYAEVILTKPFKFISPNVVKLFRNQLHLVGSFDNAMAFDFHSILVLIYDIEHFHIFAVYTNTDDRSLEIN